MAGTNIYSVYRRTARAAAQKRVVKQTSNIDIERARTDFAYFCDVVGDKPPAKHHMEWHKYLCTGEDSSCLKGIAGPNIDILGPRGPLSLNTLVATPTGWRALRDINEGDVVYGDDGLPTTVVDTVEYGSTQLYRVMFSDGTSMVCDDSHRFAVRRMGTDPKGKFRITTLQDIRCFVTTGIKGNWRTGSERTVRLAEEGEKPWLDARNYARFQVPVSAPVQYSEIDLPIHPYLLGILLGDGGLTDKTKTIVITTADKDIPEFIQTILPPGHVIKKSPWESSKYEYKIQLENAKDAPVIDGRSGGFKKLLSKQLQDLGLFGKYSYEKFIPDIYLRGSIEQREWLLRGLMDSDGTRRTTNSKASGGVGRGGLSFGSSSPKLIEGITELVRSLGGIVTGNKPYYPHYYKDGEKITSKHLAHRVGIRLPETIKPFYCERKSRLYVGPVSNRSNSGLVRSIVDIQPCGVEPVKCLTVSNKQERFLIADYVVSMNSAKSSVAGLFTAWTIGVHALHKMPLKILYISYTIDVARPKSAAIKRIIEESKIYGEVFPMVKIAKGINSNEYWSIDWKFAGIKSTGEEEFTVCCAGLKGAVTSKRSHLCLTGDTLVHTQRGPVAIREIYQRPGDYQVPTYNPKSHSVEWSGVRGVSRRLADRFIHVETSCGDIIRATPEHPFYVPGRGIIRAENLQAGDRLIGLNDVSKGSTNDNVSAVLKDIHPSRKLASKIKNRKGKGILVLKKMCRQVKAYPGINDMPGVLETIPAEQLHEGMLLSGVFRQGTFQENVGARKSSMAAREQSTTATCTAGVGFESRQYDLHIVRDQETTITCKTSVRPKQFNCASHRCQSEEQRFREFDHLVQTLPHKLSSNGAESETAGATIATVSEHSSGEEYVYDLETESENHNFFSGKSGYCVSNCLIDDICKSADEIKNREIRAAMEDNWNSVIVPTMFEGGRAICLGTRFRHDDMHGTTFIPANDWVQLVQSAIVVDENGDEESYWPEMWSLEYLQDRRRQAPIAFSFQYQNQIVQTSELSLSPDLIVKGTIATQFDSLGVGVDLSAGVRERNDYTVFVMGGRVGDKIHIVDCKRIRIMGNLEKLEALMEMMEEWGVIHKDKNQYFPTGSHVDIWSEAVAYQASLEADFKRICLGDHGLYNLNWHAVKGFRGDKVARFRGIMGLFEQRKLVFNKYRRFTALTDEIINFGVSSHDDCVDALIWLCNGLMTRGALQLEY